jgi:hypothetical protein
MRRAEGTTIRAKALCAPREHARVQGHADAPRTNRAHAGAEPWARGHATQGHRGRASRSRTEPGPRCAGAPRAGAEASCAVRAAGPRWAAPHAARAAGPRRAAPRVGDCAGAAGSPRRGGAASRGRGTAACRGGGPRRGGRAH